MSTAAPAPSKARVAIAVAVGNFMEWFDFAVYGFFAVTIGHLFFPENTDPLVSLLSSFAVFAVGFFMRPLGGFILGPIGDRYGRRAALMISVLSMGISTTLIGILPVYSVVGLLAPVLLVLCRCVQGLSAGGEWTGSSAYLIESTPTKHRGKFGSIISATAALATIAGSLFALFLNNTLSDDALVSWGWRLPFLMAAPLALVGLYIRMKLGETPVYESVAEQGEVLKKKSPLVDSVRYHWKQILLTLAIAAVQGTGFYYLATFTVNYLTETVGFDRGPALGMSAIGLTVYMVLCPIAGALSDRFGRRRLNIIGTIGYILLPLPVFWMMSNGSPSIVVIGMVLLTMTQSLVSVTTVVMLTELFPANNRSSGSAIGFNIALAFIAGPASYIGTWLVSATGVETSPSWYLIVLAVIALPFLWKWLPETAGRDITTMHSAGETQTVVTAKGGDRV